MPRASAPSLPGRTRSQQSAFAASLCWRGSMTISLAPLAFDRLIRRAVVGAVAWGLMPQKTMQRVEADYRRPEGAGAAGSAVTPHAQTGTSQHENETTHLDGVDSAVPFPFVRFALGGLPIETVSQDLCCDVLVSDEVCRPDLRDCPDRC
jgi:hypothetical protein